MITRRQWGRILGGVIAWGLTRPAQAAVPPVIEHMAWDTLPGDAGRERRYRADAYVLLLSLPLLHRENIGGGSVIWREAAAQPDGAAIRLLEFTGFSRPDRAAGLNRLGFLREMTHIGGDGVTQSHYLGVMTSSPEENVEEARKALHSQAKEVTYTAIDGLIGLADSRTVTAHFNAPATLSIDKKGELLERARQALSTALQDKTDANGQTNEPPFLEAVASLLRQPTRKECLYSYSGTRYRLSLTQSPDSQATLHFRDRGLLSANGTAIRAAGKVKKETGGPEKHFRLWFEQGIAQPLPLRIEYLPKSYLRLVFEAES